MIPWLSARGAVAAENDRTMHSGIIPKGGGLPLLIVAVAALTAIHPLTAFPLPAALGLLALMLLSWIDDIRHLTAAVRLPVHLAIAALLCLTLPNEALVFQGWLPFALDRTVAIVALTWMMNLYNFMDGINGLAGAETVAITSGYLLLGTAGLAGVSYMPLAAAVLGAAGGFLVWNLREKALVFMGDVGSVPLGFLMGTLCLDLALSGAWAAALILPSYFLADATITLLKRLFRGEKIWEAHRSHFYQRAARGLGAHLPAVARISFANALLIAVALLSISAPWLALALGLVIVVTLLAALEYASRSS